LAPVRFTARVLLDGVSPYVDVPDRVCRAFAGRERAGRIRVEGTLHGVAVRGTVVKRGEGHRLHLHGGMRRAAGVKTGQTVALELRAIPPDAVSVPSALTRRLRRAGALDRFRELPASQRRELVRWIDAATTDGDRSRRVDAAVAQSLGKPAAATRSLARHRPLWSCPKCGNSFVTANVYHSCNRVSLAAAFEGKPAHVRDLFDRLRAMVESFGPVRLVPYRNRVGFMVRVRFAGATPRRGHLDVGFWLHRRLRSPRLRRVETLTPTVHLHSVRIGDPLEIDGELRAWLREAYAIGCQSGAAVG
jgi:hypothetical protein